MNKTPNLRKPIDCKDGSKVSVQASDTHHSIPRTNEFENIWDYDLVEVAIFDGNFPFYMREYADPTTVEDDFVVFGYVPVELAKQLIEDRGGQEA